MPRNLTNSKAASKTYTANSKVYNVEPIPPLYVLRSHPDALLRELSFRSPYIIKYYSIKCDFSNQKVYTVLEKIKGTSLDQLLLYGSPPYHVVKEVIFKILKGFALIHQKNILHRDVCLKNILVEFNFPSFNPKISGFNIFQPADPHNPMHLTDDKYLAPEVEEYADYNPKAEVWALGVLVYQVLQMKFQPESIQESETDIDMSIIPNCFKAFIQAALTPNPEQRPETTKALNRILYRDLSPEDKVIFDVAS